MNSQNRNGKERRVAGVSFARGQSALELAIAVPALVLLLLAGADFARVFYFNIEVNNAARAGAQYGSQSLTAAADSNGMVAAATQDGSNLPSFSAQASQCACGAGSSVSSCAASYCAANPEGNYVEVDTNATFNTTISYPGIPSSVSLKGKAIMQVQQE